MSDEHPVGATAQPDGAPPRRRTTRVAAGRRLDATSVVAVLLAAVTIGLAQLVHADADPVAARAPAATPLTRATLICPGDGPVAGVTSTSGARGTVGVRGRDEQADVEVAPAATSVVPGRVAGAGPLVVTGLDDVAPGLVAGRFDLPLASTECAPPTFDAWFTGAGAGARHLSVLELTNPDGGRAVVDVTVYDANGVVDEPDLLGLAVPGGSTVRLDLAREIPNRSDLALRVQTTRGRVSASVLDTFDQLGAGASGSDWLPAQPSPATTNLMLGLPGGGGQRVLVLANPGDDEGRASIRLVDSDSTFSPEGLDDLVLPPQSVVRLSISAVLKAAEQDDATGRPLGVQVESTVPATAGLRLFVDGDLAQSTPITPIESSAPVTAVVPGGDLQLVLGGATGAGVVTVTSRDAEGRQLAEERVEVGPGRAATLDLPTRTGLVTVASARTPVQAVVVATGDGATLVRPRAPVLTGPVPQLRPGLP